MEFSEIKAGLEEIREKAQGLLNRMGGGKVTVSTPFGTYERDENGVLRPVNKVGGGILTEGGDEFSDFVLDESKSYASYIGAHSLSGLVALIRMNWQKRDSFHQFAKDFIADWPQYFSGME